MTREAAVLGVPSYSFFMGRPGKVDMELISRGNLRMLKDVAQVRGYTRSSAENTDHTIALDIILQSITTACLKKG